MNTNILIGALAVGAVVLMVVFSFNNDEEGLVENENTAEEEMVDEVSIPTDLPPNVLIYPEAILKNTQEIGGEDARNITLTLETSDSVADVNTWYRGALSNDGWSVTSDRNVGGYILLKGERENLAVFTQVAKGSEDGGAVITQRIQIK